MKIILDRNCIDYENFCLVHIGLLDTLGAHQTELYKWFFRDNVLNKSSCFHYLLPSPNKIR